MNRCLYGFVSGLASGLVFCAILFVANAVIRFLLGLAP